VCVLDFIDEQDPLGVRGHCDKIIYYSNISSNAVAFPTGLRYFRRRKFVGISFDTYHTVIGTVQCAYRGIGDVREGYKKHVYNFTNKFDCLYGFNYGVGTCEITD